MVAIPEFAAGAMENWGLVTYREVDVLIDSTKASNSQKQRVCTVVTHELAHQWFGNLVTMSWWDDLWLNEGFASWAENWCGDKVYPEYKMWDQFVTNHLSAALRLDALKSSHPIQVPIQHAEEVEQVFDAISYCKGASVVKMIKAVLGMKAFQTGLQNYMKKHAYGNTETFHLWNAWEESSGMPVGELMASWTEQMGFPLLRVTGEKWADDMVTLNLEQVWFLSDGTELSEEEQKKKWCIPIMTCTAEGTQSEIVLMREKTATVTIPLANKDAWVKLNAGQEVPMRVVPTAAMSDRLVDGIRSKKLPVADRAGLISDAYALVKAGLMKPENMLKLLAAYSNEDNYIVWSGIADVLIGLDTVLSEDEVISKNFAKFAKGMVTNLAKSVGWDMQQNEGHLTVLLRGIMINLLSNFAIDDADVVAEATRRFKAFQKDANDVQSLPSDMRSSVFKIYLKSAPVGSSKEYSDVKSYFVTADDSAEQKLVLSALGHTLDPMLKEQTMEWALSGEIKVQDFFYPMGSVGRSSKKGREVSWAFFQKNFDKIKKMIGNGSPSLMDACIVTCAGTFCTREKAEEIECFFKDHPLPNNKRRIAQATEVMRGNAQFLDILQASNLAKEGWWTSIDS